MQEFISKLPRAILHVHLEGTLETVHSFELAARNDVELEYSTPEEVVSPA